MTISSTNTDVLMATTFKTLDAVRAFTVDACGETPLDQYAADELRRLISALFNKLQTASADTTSSNDCLRLLMGTASQPRIAEALASLDLEAAVKDHQQYVIAPLDLPQPTLLISGGSSQAVLWAVYELAEQWGARFLFEGDVLEANQDQMSVPGAAICRSPLIEVRAWRSMNQLPHSGAYWGLSDYKQLIDQLAKMRFNVLYWATYPYNPFVDIHWEGVTRQTAELNFGLQIPLDDETIGLERFSGETVFCNPDFPHEGTPQERITAAKQLLSSVQSCAKSRGLQFGFMMIFTEFADEYKRRLRELSIADGFEPNPVESGHLGRIGVQREGMDPVFSGYSSVRNPRYLDLAEAQLRAHIEQLSGLDYLVLAYAEFASFGADAEDCWRELCERYQLQSLGSLDDVVRAAADELKNDAVPIAPERVALAIRAEVSAIYLLDHIFHTKGLLQDKPSNLKLLIKLSEHVTPLFRGVFGQSIEVISTLGGGYLPSDTAKHADQLKNLNDPSNACHVSVSIEDDNIGESVQQTTGSMHKILTSAKANGVKGFWGRQWLTNKIGPAISYISHACWEELTPEESYRHLFSGVCGEEAVEPMISAFEYAEALTLHNDEHGLGHSFLVPTMLSDKWKHTIVPSEKMLAAREQCDQFITLLNAAREVAKPSSHDYIDQFIGQAQFTRDWLTVIEKLMLAAQAAEAVVKQRKAGDPDGVDREYFSSVTYLDEAIAASKTAIESWARAVRDRADLGTLAALNYYGHRFLCNQRYMQYLNANMWSWTGLDKAEPQSRV